MESRRVAFALLLLLAVAGCGGPAPSSGSGDFPEFALSSLGGETVSRASLAGKVVVYDFWATWCGPCHLQADIVREIYAGLRQRGVEVVGIATGEEPQTVREFAARRPYPWPILLDPEESVSNALEVFGLPTLVVTCRSGAISFRQTGVVDGERLEREVAAAESC